MEIPESWTFKNTSIANNFEKHVREQLPWYDFVTSAVVHIVRHYLPTNGSIYDIGASTGNIGRAIAEILESRNASLTSIEESAEMLKLFNAPGTVLQRNALEVEYEKFDVAVLMLALMFFPPESRKQFLSNLCNKVKPGGCIILVDKIQTPSSYLSTVLHRLTIAGKVSTGTSSEDIIKKELSIGGIQRPLPNYFVSLLPLKATEFFRFGEFAGWVFEAPE